MPNLNNLLMLRTTKQTLQLHTISSIIASPGLRLGNSQKLRTDSIVRSLLYNLACVCLFAFREEIKEAISYLGFPTVFDLLINALVDISTTLIIASIICSPIEHLVKNWRDRKVKH